MVPNTQIQRIGCLKASKKLSRVYILNFLFVFIDNLKVNKNILVLNFGIIVKINLKLDRFNAIG